MLGEINQTECPRTSFLSYTNTNNNSLENVLVVIRDQEAYEEEKSENK